MAKPKKYPIFNKTYAKIKIFTKMFQIIRISRDIWLIKEGNNISNIHSKAGRK